MNKALLTGLVLVVGSTNPSGARGQPTLDPVGEGVGTAGVGRFEADPQGDKLYIWGWFSHVQGITMPSITAMVR
ncbi:MAG: hypothetical protein H6594_08755 [Flavobacteriales bacterium]|nr:hypothetical protein [Flavobacteriales bacterium]